MHPVDLILLGQGCMLLLHVASLVSESCKRSWTWSALHGLGHENDLVNVQAIVWQEQALFWLLMLVVKGRDLHAQQACAVLNVCAEGPEAVHHLQCLYNVLWISFNLGTGTNFPSSQARQI